MTYESAVAAAWPAVAAVGRSELRRFRLSPEVVDDLLQEAAAIVLRRRPEFSTSDELAPYVRIVVRRAAMRWLRNQAREVVGPIPERASAHLVADLVEHRLKLRGTAMAFAGLSASERGRLRAYLTTDARVGDARERARERKQIERIRTTMQRVSEGFAAAFGWLRTRFGWMDPLSPAAGAAVMTLTGLVALLLPYGAGTDRAGADDSTVYTLPASVSPASAVSDEATSGGGDVPRPGSAGSTRPPAPGAGEPRTGGHVVRVIAPTGDDVGWKKEPNPTGNAFVCVTTTAAGRRCVNQVSPPVTVAAPGLP